MKTYTSKPSEDQAYGRRRSHAKLNLKIRMQYKMKPMFKIFLVLLAGCGHQIFGGDDSLPGKSFFGDWSVIRIIEVEEGEPGPEGTETSYPKALQIKSENHVIKANYMDQFSRAGVFTPEITNQGNDLILFDSKMTTKSPDSYCIVHHIKVFGDTLCGVTFGRTRLFEWRSIRQINAPQNKMSPKPGGKSAKSQL